MLKKLIPCITFFFICCNSYATEGFVAQRFEMQSAPN